MLTKYYKYFFIIITFFSFFWVSYSADFSDIEKSLENFSVDYQDKNYFSNNYEIDISDLSDSLQENFWNIELRYSWEIFSHRPQEGPKLSINFDSPWEKAIELNIFATIEEEEKLIYSSDFTVFIYRQSIALLSSNSVSKKAIADYIDAAEDLWVFIYQLANIHERNLSWESIMNSFTKYRLSFPESSDYIAVWWEKEFLFSALSEIRTTNLESQSLNLVLISSYNTSILQNYISNSIAGKNFIKEGFIIDESLRFQILKNPQNIVDLKKQVETDNYSYTSISEQKGIAPYFFVSQFINTLSNTWVKLSDIYIILLLPIFLTLVGFSKHVIWISTLGTIIPVFMSLLYIELWIPFTLWLLALLVIVNIWISKFISKYTLLYTPKVTFITILNLFVFMFLYQVVWYFDILEMQLDNILYIVLFFIIAEKLITIITSKEFREYKKSLSWTIIISLLCYMLYNIDTLLVFLAAYPEVLIILVPFNFILGRFTGLRITEYLRFREIVKSIEE